MWHTNPSSQTKQCSWWNPLSWSVSAVWRCSASQMLTARSSSAGSGSQPLTAAVYIFSLNNDFLDSTHGPTSTALTKLRAVIAGCRLKLNKLQEWRANSELATELYQKLLYPLGSESFTIVRFSGNFGGLAYWIQNMPFLRLAGVSITSICP